MVVLFFNALDLYTSFSLPAAGMALALTAGPLLRREWLRIYIVPEMKDATVCGLTAWRLIVMSIMSLKMLETGKISVVVWEILEKHFNHEVYREEKVSYVFFFFWYRWILLEVLDNVYPGSVNWKRAYKPPIEKPFKKIENCNQVVKIGKDMRFSLENVAGNDIVQGNKKLILGNYSSILYFFLSRSCSIALEVL